MSIYEWISNPDAVDNSFTGGIFLETLGLPLKYIRRLTLGGSQCSSDYFWREKQLC